jgi:hypothetical protein
MTTAELAEATKEFDRENIADTFREMTAAEERAWRAAVNKRRRGQAGSPKSVKTVALQMDAAFLKRVDALAKKRGLTRARLIRESLEAMLGKRGA